MRLAATASARPGRLTTHPRRLTTKDTKDTKEGPKIRLVRGHLNGERAHAADRVLGRHFPFTERRAVEWVETAAAAVRFEHGEHRRWQRGQQLSVHHRTCFRPEQLDVERVVPPRL